MIRYDESFTFTSIFRTNFVETPILTVKNLTSRLQLGKDTYTVVDQLSFQLYKGKTLALVGESGCGKSMTALSLMRILPTPPALPPQGEVLYKGENLLQISEKRMRRIRGGKVAMIFQDPMTALNPVYTIGQQLAEVVHLHLGVYGRGVRSHVLDALSEVGIRKPQECFDAYPHRLSGGMQQRAMIAMALLCEPDILIADEPSTALDVTIQHQVLELMRSLQRIKNMAILLITHDMGVVAEMADEVVVMYATQAIERGSVFDIFDRMAHPYTQGLFHSLPQRQSERGRLKAISGMVPPITQLPSGCRFHPRCPHCMPRCKKGSVKEFDAHNKGDDPQKHRVRCWLYETIADQASKEVKYDPSFV